MNESLQNQIAELQESEQRFRLLTEAMPQMVFTASPEGEPNYFNERWYTYTGGERAQPDGHRWQHLLHPDEVELCVVAWRKAYGALSTFTMELRLQRADGVFRWHLVRAIPVLDGLGKLQRWCGTCTDIDEQKRVMERLREERELREKFVFALTHDLRTPLTAVKASAQLMRRYPERAEIRDELTARIIADVERADLMIRDLLDANRIRAGQKLPLSIGMCDLAAVARDVLNDLALIHGDRFVLNAVPQIGGYWSVDGLRRVIENLASNAVKYGGMQSPIAVSLTAGLSRVAIAVHNLGNPLSREDQRGVFRAFHRTPSAQRSRKKGWGIGLTLVRGIVEAHGGTVRVESSPENGTVFTIELPRDSRTASCTVK